MLRYVEAGKKRSANYYFEKIISWYKYENIITANG